MCRVEIGTVALDKTSCQLLDRWIAVEIFGSVADAEITSAAIKPVLPKSGVRSHSI